jgi:DNA-binding NarL/FixJ family response regulator
LYAVRDYCPVTSTPQPQAAVALPLRDCCVGESKLSLAAVEEFLHHSSAGSGASGADSRREPSAQASHAGSARWARLAAQGHGARDIAEHLSITERTVARTGASTPS